MAFERQKSHPAILTFQISRIAVSIS